MLEEVFAGLVGVEEFADARNETANSRTRMGAPMVATLFFGIPSWISLTEESFISRPPNNWKLQLSCLLGVALGPFAAEAYVVTSAFISTSGVPDPYGAVHKHERVRFTLMGDEACDHRRNRISNPSPTKPSRIPA